MDKSSDLTILCLVSRGLETTGQKATTLKAGHFYKKNATVNLNNIFYGF